MITLDAILHTAIGPAFKLLPAKMDSDAARVMLLAIGLQESRFEFRFQKTSDPYRKGPARGFWQNERGGGVRGVMTSLATRQFAMDVCKAQGVPFDDTLVHARLEFDDVLAAAIARLILWADPRPLPGVDASDDETWGCYFRNWLPGHPRRETWDEFHAQASAQVIA